MYGERKSWKLVFGLLFILPLLGLIGGRIVKAVSFDRDCAGHIKRAGDANTVEMAKQEMVIVVEYLDENNLTEGYTSVLYNTPDEDIGFWYKNLRSSLEELEKVRPETSQLERSNILLKLRQTLLDNTKGGEQTTEPDAISVFPNNKEYALAFILFIILALYGGILLWQYSDE